METTIKRDICILISCLLFTGGSVQAAETVANQYIGDVIDIPTAHVVDHYGYNVSFRFGKDGNLQTKPLFGVFPRLNLGFGLDGEGVLGTDNARLNKPTINVKYQLFDGRKNLPQIALGFDGQGYEFDKTTDEYEQHEKGLYLVGSHEIFLRGLEAHVGGNVFDFDRSNTERGFFGFSYIYERTIGLLFEWDNVTHYADRHINYGAKYFVTPAFSIDAVARNVRIDPAFRKRETERLVRLNYSGSF